MKKYAFVMAMIMVIGLFACGKTEKTNPVDVAVYYGVSSYALFSSEESIVSELADFYNTLEVIETDEKLDLFTAYLVSFKDKKFWVDINGVIWLNGETKCYKKVFGSLDYDRITEIYKGNTDNEK
ncbi:MAG: hypothetical protein ACYCWE_00160 [Eubacteriales bacterium]